MMVADHSKANAELNSLATKKNVQLPAELDESHSKTLQEIRSAEGVNRDKAYVNAMIDDHETSVELFGDQAEDPSDPEVQAFAVKTLPKLRQHLEAIRGISEKQ